MQNGILAARFREAGRWMWKPAEHRRNFVEASTREQALERENAEIRLQAAKDLAAREAEARTEATSPTTSNTPGPAGPDYVTMSYDEERAKFVATCSEIRAYGNSPEEAFRNFDQLWLEGHYQDTL